MNKKFGAITSSQDPEEIATKVKGVVLLFSSLIILVVSRLFGIGLTATDITSLATDAGMLTGAVLTVYGTGLHILALFFKQPTA